MEGWDGTTRRPADGAHRAALATTSARSGAGWSGAARRSRCAREGRANPHQLVIDDAHRARARRACARRCSREARARRTPSRWSACSSRTAAAGRARSPAARAPRVAFRHPLLDPRSGVADDAAVLSDAELDALVARLRARRAARAASRASTSSTSSTATATCCTSSSPRATARGATAARRSTARTRFAARADRRRARRRARARIGVRLSVFDVVPHAARRDGARPGVPEATPLPYDARLRRRPGRSRRASTSPSRSRFVRALVARGVAWINVTAASPYYAPHVQRPALFPPSDGYPPPEDPLAGVARLLDAARALKAAVPGGDRRVVGLDLPAGVPPARRAGVRARRLVRRGRPRPHGARRTRSCRADVLAGRPLDAQAALPHLQRLHDRAAQRAWSRAATRSTPFYRARPERAALEAAKRGAAMSRRASPADALGAPRRARACTASRRRCCPTPRTGAIDWAAFERHVARTRAAGPRRRGEHGHRLRRPARRRPSARRCSTRRGARSAPACRFYAGAFARRRRRSARGVPRADRGDRAPRRASR